MKQSVFAFGLAWLSGALLSMGAFVWALGKLENLAGLAGLAFLTPFWGLLGVWLRGRERQPAPNALFAMLDQLNGNLTQVESHRLYHNVTKSPEANLSTGENWQRVQMREQLLRSAASGRGFSNLPPLL